MRTQNPRQLPSIRCSNQDVEDTTIQSFLRGCLSWLRLLCRSPATMLPNHQTPSGPTKCTFVSRSSSSNSLGMPSRTIQASSHTGFSQILIVPRSSLSHQMRSPSSRHLKFPIQVSNRDLPIHIWLRHYLLASPTSHLHITLSTYHLNSRRISKGKPETT